MKAKQQNKENRIKVISFISPIQPELCISLSIKQRRA
jgi:hypothetical protein